LICGHSTDASIGTIQTEGDKHFIHTFEFVSLFSIKIYENYLREKLMPTNLRNVHNLETLKSTGSAAIYAIGSNAFTVGHFQLFWYGNCVS
jgi:hypothetical protein